MRAHVTPDLLAHCLEEVERGNRTIEECVAAHSEVADELRSLLEVVHSISLPPSVVPDPSFCARGRAALIATISAEKEAAAKPLSRHFWSQISVWLTPPQPGFVAKMSLPTMVIALATALAATVGGGAVYASQDALPGDALYQVKTAVEGLQLALATGDEAKAEVHTNLAAKRMSEVQKASENGNSVALGAAVESLAQNLVRAGQHLDSATAAGRDASAVAAQLAENLARQQEWLRAVEAKVPDQAKLALTSAEEITERGLEIAVARAQKTPVAGPIERPTSAPTSTVEEATPTTSPMVSAATSATLTQLISDTYGLAYNPSVPGQSYEGLIVKLQAAQSALDRGQTEVAARLLEAFREELNALRRFDRVGKDSYDTLYARYSALASDLAQTATAAPTPARTAPTTGQPEAIPDQPDTSQGREVPADVRRAPAGEEARPVRRPTEAPVPTKAPPSTGTLRAGRNQDGEPAANPEATPRRNLPPGARR